MQEKLDLKYPIVVEGRYDKAKVSMVISSPIIALDGFSVFNNSEKKELLKRLALEKGLIILTDSDRAGNFIRGKLKGFLSGKVYNVYAPEIVGKERRKKKASSDGLLGVEGMELSVLRELLLPFSGGDLPKSAFISGPLPGPRQPGRLRLEHRPFGRAHHHRQAKIRQRPGLPLPPQ